MEQASNSVTPSSSLPAVVRRERGNLLIECVPEEVPPHLSQRLEQYQNTRSCSLEDFHLASASPSIQGLLVTTRFGETTQVHYVQQPGGYRKQLTFFQEPVAGAAACPNAQAEHRDCFLFARDVGGTEQYQNYCFDMSTGEYVMLSDGTSKNGFPIWSNKGDRCAYYSTRRNGKDWDIYISPLPSLSSSFASTAVEPEMVLSEGGSWYPVDWSPDDSCLLVKKYISANESQLWTLDLQTKQLQRIPPLSSSKEEEEKIAYGSTCFGKWMAGEDGMRSAGIFLTTDEGSEFKQLWFYDLENKRFTSQESLTKDIEWDVNAVRFCPFTHTKLAFTTNEGGIFQIYILDLVSGRRKRAGGLPIGILGSLRFHPDGKHLGVTINTSQTPSDVFLISLPESFDDEEPVYYPSVERWTFSEVGGLNTDTFVMPSLIHYPTFDDIEIEKDGGQQKERRKIPAFYYKPPASKKDGTTSSRYPVMIIIHGGPESQSLPSFTAKIQYFCLEMGIAVLVPNVRGSSGYGKTYLLLDNWYKREDSVKDIGSLIDWIAEQQELDENRILVNGGSYGGYMVLASMIHYSDKLRAGVERVGISNFVTFLEKTSDYRRDNRREEYGDERIPEMREFLLRISPLTNAHRIDKPMLIAQGLNDPRVPVYESEQVVAAIRQNGVPVWYLLAKDEGHGFHKKANVDYYLTAEAMFVRQHLL